MAAARLTMPAHMRIVALIVCLCLGAVAGAATTNRAIVMSEFIFESAPFPECHASTIVEANGMLVASWFGGTREGNKDVQIWTSHRNAKESFLNWFRTRSTRWAPPVAVASGIVGANRFPTWNPVFFQPMGQPLTLYYKVGPSPEKWWGMRMSSTDGAKTWSVPERLPDGILGPIKNRPVQLLNGRIISGVSTEHDGWRVHFEVSFDSGTNFLKTASVADPKGYGAIQPSILVHGSGALQALCRSKTGGIVETWSHDGGLSWSELKPTGLANPNAGIDAMTLRDGRHLLVFNDTPKGRTPLNVATSTDGREWKRVAALETASGEYSYPAVIQSSDGLVHITYTWKRQRIKYVVLDPAKL